MRTFVVWILSAAAALAADNWAARELKEAARQLDSRQYARAREIYHNLLLIHRVAPLSANTLQQACGGLAASSRANVDDPNSISDKFIERVKSLGFEQAGPAWVPADLKKRLPADAVAKLEQLSHADKCPACKGRKIVVCTNCDHGRAHCNACSGTGRTGGASISSRGTTCVFCGGRGVVACVACVGTGLKKQARFARQRKRPQPRSWGRLTWKPNGPNLSAGAVVGWWGGTNPQTGGEPIRLK